MQAGLRISFLMKWFLHNKRLCVRNSEFEKNAKETDPAFRFTLADSTAHQLVFNTK
jgi:hypothetical protein